MAANKKPRNYRENKVARAWLEYVHLQYPVVAQHIIKIDNEGTTNRAQAVSLGLHVGASDYLIAWPTLDHYGLFLEIKPDGWVMTKSNMEHTQRQLFFGNKMAERGYKFSFCIGLDRCIEATDEYLSQRKAV